jgi:hypothetical protein
MFRKQKDGFRENCVFLMKLDLIFSSPVIEVDKGRET